MPRKTGEKAEREGRKERFVGTETAKLLEKEREGGEGAGGGKRMAKSG